MRFLHAFAPAHLVEKGFYDFYKFSKYKMSSLYIAMFGEAKRALQYWNIEINSSIYRAKISKQGLRKENRMFEQ